MILLLVIRVVFWGCADFRGRETINHPVYCWLAVGRQAQKLMKTVCLVIRKTSLNISVMKMGHVVNMKDWIHLHPP